MMPAARYKSGAARPSFPRQRIIKSGTYTAVGGSTMTQVTGTWVPDVTAPCTVSGASMVIVGNKADATLQWNCPGTGTGIQFKKNGTVIAGSASAARTGSKSGISVAAGDLITCEIQMAFYPNSTLTGGGWYEFR